MGLEFWEDSFFLVIQTSFIIQFGISGQEKNTTCVRRTFKATVLHLQKQGIPGKMNRGYICLQNKKEQILSSRDGGTGIFVLVLCFVCMCCQKSRNLMHK